ncbi:hypothetical protein D1B33_05405 [Lysinibacillus yapensis]|uniref:Enoyl-CoA hydratase/isomerase family protein n=1 Tax=Ureibacillus yapensis TaxID=2304605 RepID=A0A396SB47_9BACL|nr:enoyl-CoA hydratase-related protein [Lysinibacillus yapensis]RHW38323.1 hypothetical protein D1B33_05405 [Lysinibacillus yapensis]
MSKSVLLDIEDKMAIITLNEPSSLNALSEKLVKDFTEALEQIKYNPKIRVVLLKGNGRVFSTGGNIKDFPEEAHQATVGREYMDSYANLIRELAQLELPTIAAVHGYSYGAGFSIALACDFIVASASASFSMVFNKVGLVPDLAALYHLPRIVGMARAKEIVYSARAISAQEAKEYGMVFEIVSEEELHSKALELAESFTTKATRSIGLTKYLLNQSFELPLPQFLQQERLVQAVAFSSDDFAEGSTAFLEKRKPNFQGK